MNEEKNLQTEEIILRPKNGMTMLLLGILLAIGGCAVFVAAVNMSSGAGVALLIFISFVIIIASVLCFTGLLILKPNEAYVLTLFGKYYGTLKGEGFFYINPFASAVAPASTEITSAANSGAAGSEDLGTGKGVTVKKTSPRLSLKTMTLNNDKQKVNDQLGNPIIIGIVVIWRVKNTAKAMFNVDNFKEFLSIQCDSALRNIVRLYPYDVSDNDGKVESLRGSSQEIAERLRDEIQEKVDVAGLEIIEARITHLAYAPEIASVMLQRQQASAVIDARQMIVDGAVGMVEMALNKLSQHNIVDLDEERKAAMVSNLMVVLCSNRDAQPIINSGSLY